MNRIVCLSIVSVFAAGLVVSAQARQIRQREDVLLDVLVWGLHMAPRQGEVYPDNLKADIDAYLRRAAAYRSTRAVPIPGGTMEMVHEAEVNYEVRLAAISDRSDSPQLAVEYVDGLRPCYEWEGMSDCPESEALFAEKYQAAHPAGPFSGYLPLLAAHRWLCVAEVFDTELRPNDATRVRNSSQKWLQIAVQSPLRLVRVAAEQLSRRGRCHSPA